MFHKVKIFSFALLSLFFSFLLVRTIPFSQKDLAAYNQFKEGFGKKNAKKLPISDSTQRKKKITKDFWLVKDGQRLHHQIKYVAGDLNISTQKGKQNLQEHMHDIQAWIQEGLIHNGKKEMHFLTANEGTYLYREKEFKAKNVDVTYYQTTESDSQKIQPGKEEILMQGIAKEVDLILQKSELFLHAYQLKANIY